jgi:GDP-4-dehydro-6-deoxy-D-mannose reductase
MSTPDRPGAPPALPVAPPAAFCQSRPMRVWVSGAAGFVGRRLVARLEQQGAQVLGCDHEVDVADAQAVRRSISDARPEALVHLAAVTYVPAAASDPALAFRVNFLGTLHVLQAVRREVPEARVLVVSSGAVYGTAAPDDPPFDEGRPLRPGSIYARAKAAADLLGGAFAARGLDVVRVRPFNHTGAGRPDRFVESRLARQLAEIELHRRPLRLHVGNVDAARDFLHVDDVVEAYCALLRRDVAPGIYNVASGRATSIRALIDLLLAQTGLAPEIVVDRDLWRPADVIHGSARRLAAATGWRPTRTLEETLAEILAYWRAQVGRGLPASAP